MSNQIEHTLDELIKILKNGTWEERRDAAEALGKLGNRRAVQPLIETVSNQFGNDYGHPNYKALQDWMVREQAAKALGNLGDERAIKPLINAFRDKSGHVWAASVRALGQIGEPALKSLLNALKETDWSVRRGAVSTLGWLGDQRAFQSILVMLEDSDFLVRQYAIDALFQCGGKQIVDLLIEMLKKDEVHHTSVSVLGTIDDERALPFLEKVKSDTSDKIKRGLAIEVLENRLCTLAGAFRGSENPSQREDRVREYRTVMEKLYFLEWDGSLDIECELPDELMPTEYLRRT